ncbi:MAG: caspase family protein [Gemmatimonadaceae bacterium]|nr:caspase family protein [Gemmatimonadaceae bacterium]
MHWHRLTMLGPALATALLLGGRASRTVHGMPHAPVVSTASEGRRIALLIGIADYRYFGADGQPGQTDLRGPHTDVARVKRSLERFGFADSLTTVLVDSQASRTALRDAFAALARQVRGPDDVLVIYYSGHGTQVPDDSGDEDDGADEALAPWDVQNVRDARQVVSDDSIGVWLDAIPTRNITLIVDACFSGTITRATGDGLPRGGPALVGARRKMREAPVSEAVMSDVIGAAAGEFREVPYTVITAASAGELAVELEFPELGNRTAGVFTYQLTRVLDQARGATIRYDAFMGLVRDEVRRWSRQTPQLEGTAAARAARLFSVGRDSLPPLSAPVVRQRDGSWTVGMGAVHGVRRGTTFDVVADDGGAARPLGQFIVDSVGDDVSRVVPDDSTAAAARGSAVLSTMPPNARAAGPLHVWVSPNLGTVRSIVERIPFATVATDSTTADAVLMPAGNGVAVRVAGAPLRALPRWRYPPGGAYAPWVSDSTDLVFSGDARAANYARSGTGICTALQRAWVISGLRSVTNPVRNYNLGLDVRVVPAGDPPPRSATPVDTLRDGMSYDLLVRATSFTNAPVFLSLAIVGQRGIPLTSLLPDAGLGASAASDSVNLKENGGWARIRFGRATAPFGAETIVAYLGAFPYAFGQLVSRVPPCTAVQTRALERDPAITGWTATSRRVVFVPRPAGR